MAARRRQQPKVGDEYGVWVVARPPYARLIETGSTARNRYFVDVKCRACGLIRNERQDGINRLRRSGCGNCGAYPPEVGDYVEVTRVLRGKTQTYRRARFHGGSYDALHGVWANMRERCQNPKSEKWAFYGGRGITVCEAWQDYVTFKEWATSHGYEPGLELDRTDNDGPYSPENCAFRTNLDNLLNRRSYLPTELDSRLQTAATDLDIDRYQVIHRAISWYRTRQEEQP